MLTILSENNYKRLEYAAYYHQNEVNHGGTITTHCIKVEKLHLWRLIYKASLYLKMKTTLYLLFKSKPWRDGV